MTMKTILLLTFLANGIYSRKTTFTQLAAKNADYITELQRSNKQEIECLKRFDSALESKWKADLSKISTSDLTNVPSFWEYKEPSKAKYNTVEQEWLMDDASPGNRIDACFRQLAGEIAPLLSRKEVDCLNGLFGKYIVDEKKRESEFKAYLRKSSQDQLPFRRFISFTEFVEMMFQNKNVDALEGIERTVYEHAESYLSTEQDTVDKMFIIEQECQWKDAKALREARSEDAKYKEFVKQVRRSVNRQVAHELLKNWDLNTTLPRRKHRAWLKARKEMLTKIRSETDNLKTKRKDAQWLCEYATKLAYNFSDEQSALLLSGSTSDLGLGSKAVAGSTRSVEKELARREDFRRNAFRALADDFEEGARCVSSFKELIENQQRFALAMAFIDGRYSYPEVFCTGKNLNFGLISTRLCNCVGSFCVTHELAALFAEQYVLKLGSDGVYRVVPSGTKTIDKVSTW